MTEPTDALELLREIYADLVQGAIPNADDHWWQKARAVLAKWGQPAPQPSHIAQAAVPADLMTFTSSTQPALQQAHHEEQPDGTTIPLDPSEMAPQQPAPAPMSPANRLVAYSAATRLRELGFEWDATAEAWLQPAPSAQAADRVLEDAARYRWLREGNDAKHGAAWHVAVNLYGCEWDAAIDAAMNKGGAT